MIRKLALQIGLPTLLALMAWNAYLAVNHLKGMQNITALTMESSKMQAELSGFLKDMTEMETGQRGFLLTNDDSYLRPYSEANGRIATDFVALRAGLAHRSQQQQSLESQLESLASSKQAEMERTIRLRQQGYRLRSFRVVDTNEGKEYMDKIRQIVDSLASFESGNFAKRDGERSATLKKFLQISIASNSAVLLIAACLFGLMKRHGRLLEEETAKSRDELAVRELQLQKLTSVLSGQARSDITAINTISGLLLENYGAFLPRQGHEYAEQMKEAAAQIERLRQDLVATPCSEAA
ncbi:MAG TPA: CHASE3 domain-containing protein [Candidatus Deferrimicrobiaceae bacterium]|jgi:CHASE3 domain sensor protein|nr:CHASE3 domain-containing protein [Candidatus Deferrimicrobiaceae bacterium]